ncbi:hypothetical protein BBBGCB_BBBGCB_12715, partial [Dysosmobacter welbionis]
FLKWSVSETERPSGRHQSKPVEGIQDLQEKHPECVFK